MQKRTVPVPVIFCSVIGYMEIYIKVDRRSQIIAQISETGKISKDRVERPEGRRLAPENGDIFGSIFGGCLIPTFRRFSVKTVFKTGVFRENLMVGVSEKI